MVDIDEKADFTWKIILVGNKKVGKTSISNRYLSGEFSDVYQSTENVNYRSKSIVIPNT